MIIFFRAASGMCKDRVLEFLTQWSRSIWLEKHKAWKRLGSTGTTIAFHVLP